VVAPTADLELVRQRLRDTGANSTFGTDVDPALDTAIQRAVEEYGSDRPREVVVDLTGNATSFYDVTALTGWVNDASRVLRVEYPASAVGANYTPEFLDPIADWQIHRDTTKYYLYLIGITPAVTETIRVWFTAQHTLSTATDTIPTKDKRAVLDLAASYACLMLATEAAQSVDMDVPSEATNFREASDRLLSIAKAWRAQYDGHMSQGPEVSTKAAVAIRDWDMTPKTSPPTVWLTHRGRR